MGLTSFDDLRLKLGNLALASVLSTVPTVMTLSFLGVHGNILCSSINQSNQSFTSNTAISQSDICSKTNYITFII